MEDSILAKCEWGGVRCEWGVCVHTTQYINICQSARCVCLSAVWGRKWNLSSHKATPKELVLTVRLGQSRCLPRAVRLFAYDSLVVSLMLVSNRVPSFSTSVPIISYNCFRISLSSFFNKTVLGHTYENTTYFSQFLIVGVTRREHLL